MSVLSCRQHLPLPKSPFQNWSAAPGIWEGDDFSSSALSQLVQPVEWWLDVTPDSHGSSVLRVSMLY